MHVVIERDPDAAMHLDAILHQLDPVDAHIRLAGADILSGPVRLVLYVTGGGVGDGVAGLQPCLHVGEAVFQLLVGGQRPAE